MIAIIDYGMGNLHSVENALKKIGCECMITNNKIDLEACDGLILPGVGAFPDCMENLRTSGLIDTIITQCKQNKPLLGICLGMQVLFEKGNEIRECEGLGLLEGKIVKMVDTKVKIPHIGWNSLIKNKNDSIIDSFSKPPFVYFVHSYYVQDYNDDEMVAYATYGDLKIPAYIRSNNILGMQYHPEKSGEDGLNILRIFKEMCNK